MTVKQFSQLTLFMCLIALIITVTSQITTSQPRPLSQEEFVAQTKSNPETEFAFLNGDYVPFDEAAVSRAAVTDFDSLYNVTATDTDGDGIDDADERRLGLNPWSADTDRDFLGDLQEVQDLDNPVDADNDGRIDALEHNFVDHDLDNMPDQMDPDGDIQMLQGRFTPLAIKDDGVDSSRLEFQVLGQNIISVSVSFVRGNGIDKFNPIVDGVPVDVNNSVILELYDDGTHGDLVAGDTIWTSGKLTASSIPEGLIAEAEYSHANITHNGRVKTFLFNRFV